MILGRNAGLWVGAGFAVLDVVAAAVVVLTGQPISPADAALFLALHAAIVAFVGLVANVADPTTVPTFALTTTPTPAASTTSTGSPSIVQGSPNAAAPIDPTPAANAADSIDLTAGGGGAAGSPTGPTA